MTISSGDASESLDELLRESAARWTLWQARHPDPDDSDEYTSAIGDLIEDLLPKSDATLKRLAFDERIWTHDYGTGENTVLGSVQAAIASLIVDHLGTFAGAEPRRRGRESPR